MPIVRIEALDLEQDAHDLTVAFDHSFVANGVVVHNCQPCAQADGIEFAYGSDEYWRYLPPYQDCNGRGRCRCVQIILPATDERGAA